MESNCTATNLDALLPAMSNQKCAGMNFGLPFCVCFVQCDLGSSEKIPKESNDFRFSFIFFSMTIRIRCVLSLCSWDIEQFLAVPPSCIVIVLVVFEYLALSDGCALKRGCSVFEFILRPGEPGSES
jgi:hypothetical protein